VQTLKNRILVETEYAGANVSCIMTKGGLVYVDSPFLPDDARKWAEETRRQTGLEPAYVINTDHHYDHVLGNPFLSAKVICHTKAARGLAYLNDRKLLKEVIGEAFPEVLQNYPPDFECFIPEPVHLSFEKRLTLNMDDATFLLEYVGGHSPATIMIYWFEEKVLFTGDNVEGQFPFFGQAHFGKWKEALQKMQALDIDWVVPGHGQVGGKELIENYLAFFQALESEVKAFHSQGQTPEEMAEKSQHLDFFPSEEGAVPEQGRAWLKRQYALAAEAVLKEKLK
jgi:cyclase